MYGSDCQINGRNESVYRRITHLANLAIIDPVGNKSRSISVSCFFVSLFLCFFSIPLFLNFFLSLFINYFSQFHLQNTEFQIEIVHEI